MTYLHRDCCTAFGLLSKNRQNSNRPTLSILMEVPSLLSYAQEIKLVYCRSRLDSENALLLNTLIALQCIHYQICFTFTLSHKFLS
jgi:ABC-type antimicrobial peptide transport system ATPase subunit